MSRADPYSAPLFLGTVKVQAGAGMASVDDAIAVGTVAAAAYTLATAVSSDTATPDDLQTAANIGRLGAAATAMMLRHDIGIATAAAANAVENGFMVSRLTALRRLVSQARDQAIAEGASEEEATEMVADPRVQALAREVVAVQQEIEEELTRAEPVRAAVRQVAGSSASAASAASSSSPSWADDPPLYDDISDRATVASPLEGLSLEGDSLAVQPPTRIQASLERLAVFYEGWEVMAAENPGIAAVGRGVVSVGINWQRVRIYFAAMRTGATVGGLVGGAAGGGVFSGVTAPVGAFVGAAAGAVAVYTAEQTLGTAMQAGVRQLADAAAAQGRTPEQSERIGRAVEGATGIVLDGSVVAGLARPFRGPVGARPAPTRPPGSSAARAPAATTASSAVRQAVNRNAPTMEALAQQVRPANQNAARVFDSPMQATGTGGHPLATRMSGGDTYIPGGLRGVGRSEGLGGASGATGSGTRTGAGPVAPRPDAAQPAPAATQPGRQASFAPGTKADGPHIVLRKETGAGSEAVCTTAASNQGPYDPRAMDRLLREGYGADAVSSSTLPDLSKPNVKMAGKGITLADGTHVPFDQRGFPIFDEHAVYQTRLPAAIHQADRSTHMRHATRSLRDSIERGEISSNLFTPEQLRQINSGSERIRGLTWHHHAESGRMQLVPEELHNLAHTGGYSLWGR